MLDYFLVFNTKGLIICEKGSIPQFRDQLISNLNTNKLSGKENVRGINIFYKINGRKIYMLFTEKSTEKSLEEEINNLEKPKEVQQEEKNKKDDLDYSLSTIPEVEESFEIKKPSFFKKFNLFTKEIKVSELKERMKIHLINKNVAPLIADSFCNAIITDLEGRETVKENEFKERLRNNLSKLM